MGFRFQKTPLPLAGFCLGLALALATPLRPATGSDIFGYVFDTAAPYAFNELSASPSALSITSWVGNADEGYAQLNLPFNFTFYATPYNKVVIFINGYLQFNAFPSYFTNDCLNSGIDPKNIIAACWQDLEVDASSVVWTDIQGSSPNRQVIVEYENIHRHPGLPTERGTFEVILNEADNSIVLQYQAMSGLGWGGLATAGLRSLWEPACPNHTSLAFSCDAPQLADGLAVRFAYPSPEPACGSPTFTPTSTVTMTFSDSPTFTPTFSITNSFSASPTSSQTPTITPTLTITLTDTESFTTTPTSSITPTLTITPTATDSGTQTQTLTDSPTPTASPSGTATVTPTTTTTSLILQDVFGYRATDDAFNWISISTTASPISTWVGTTNDGYSSLDIWSSFRFYAVDYNKVLIQSNGYLQFGGPVIAYTNDCLAQLSPYNIIAGLWQDLNPGAGGAVYAQVVGVSPNRICVAQYQDVPVAPSGPGTATFEILLFEADNSIKIQYLSLAGVNFGAGATVGLRSNWSCVNRTSLPVSCDQAVLSERWALRFTYPSPEPACGSPTFTPTHTPSVTQTDTPTDTGTPTFTPTESPSSTITPTGTPSCTGTPTFSITQTSTVSPTSTPSPTITLSFTITPTFSVSPTFSFSPTISPTFSVSSTFTESPTITETSTISPTFSESPTFSASPTISETYTISPTFSFSPTQTPTCTITESFSFSPTPTQSATLTMTPTITQTSTVTPTLTMTPTATPTATATDTPTFTTTPTDTPTFTMTPTYTTTPTFTVTPTFTNTLVPPPSRPACLVLQQADFSLRVNGPVNTSAWEWGAGVAVDAASPPFRVYVSDPSQHRVLIWSNSWALVNGLPPDGVIGQANFAANSPNRGFASPAANRLNLPAGLCVDGFGNLWVADSGNHRVLKFAAPVALGGAAASLVIGQPDFTSGQPNQGGPAGPKTLSQPLAVSLNQYEVLSVADTANHRALVYHSLTTNASADFAAGQADFLSNLANHGAASPDALGLDSPAGVLLLDSSLWVSDTRNNRVLRFDTTLASGPPADKVLGQADFISNGVNRGFGPGVCNNATLSHPEGLAYDWVGRVYVADTRNNRVLCFAPPFSGAASAVYGQHNYYTYADPGTDVDGLTGPSAVWLANCGSLLVSEITNQRVLIYGCSGNLLAASATPTRTSTRTSTLTPTITLTSTVTPTITRTFTRTPTFSVSETCTISATLTVTLSFTYSPTISPTNTVTLTPTPTATITLTPTLRDTITSTYTLTPYPHVLVDQVLSFPNPIRAGSSRVSLAFPPPASPGGWVKIEVYDLLGQKVAEVKDIQGDRGLGWWDLKNSGGASVAIGIYYLRVTMEGRTILGKMTVY